MTSDAICFDGLSPDAGCAARLVVEFPRGCRLDSWHLSFLKAAAHLATVITEIDQMMGARDRAAAAETNRDLPLGWKRLVVRYLDGRLLKGFNADFAAAKGLVHVWMVPNGPEASRITVPLAHLKALFFVHDLEGDPGRRPGVDTRDRTWTTDRSHVRRWRSAGGNDPHLLAERTRILRHAARRERKQPAPLRRIRRGPPREVSLNDIMTPAGGRAAPSRARCE